MVVAQLKVIENREQAWCVNIYEERNKKPVALAAGFFSF